MRAAPASEFQQAERLPRQFRRQIPNSVMDDRRLGLAELARLCLDAAQKDGFAPSAKFVRDRISMGAFLYKSVNAELKRLGYLARQQTRPCEFASHRLNLSAPQEKGMTREGFTIPLGAAGLPYKHYAVAEWMHSFAPGFIFYPSIIRDRFGVSAVTVKRLMAAMQASGFVTKHQFRDSKSGQFDGFGYSLNADSVIAHGLQFDQSIKNRPRKNRPRKIAPHNITYPSITAAPPNQPSITPSANEGITSRKNCERPSPSQEGSSQSQYAKRKVARAERKELKRVFQAFDDAAAEPMRDTGLCTGIADSDRMLEAYFADAAGYADLWAFSDSWLSAALRKATSDRIGQHLLTPEGLETAREILEGIMCGENLSDDADGLAQAWEVLWQALWQRIGSRPGQWLNHWSLIALRIAGGGGGIGAVLTYDGENLMDLLGEQDGALMLAPALFTTPGIAQLRDLLARYDAEAAVPVICGILRRGMIGGTHEDGNITSWWYFEPAVREDMAATFRQFNGKEMPQ